MFAITEEIAVGIVLLNSLYLAMDGAGQASFGTRFLFRVMIHKNYQTWRCDVHQASGH